ncbi:unnamed protein product [Caenorhabditis angaria]|uniref:CMP/dCMP-type deaminase domain-containing protein n=1 Tax=Caenorhabditis angaria TaxID=860376 RepID=A0A9P1IGC8_9PELO|nr:unnamed protein product [Caenorhabditis angaria]
MTDEPLTKIRKLENINIIPILSPTFTNLSIETTKFVALKLEDKRSIGKIIKNLKELPENLRHLKRVGKNGQILIAETIEEAEFAVDEEFRNSLEKVVVPSTKPITRAQFEIAKHIWPTSFHPDKYLDSLIDGTFKTPELIEYVSKWSHEAENRQCISLQNQEYLCEGTSQSGPLRHPVMEMVGRMPKREESSENYLGTGCDVFLRDEPCAMCAMALVHFRIKRVFFNHNSSNGVLESSSWQLHLEPSINHHYEVYKIEK